jgi:hypothetical protein
VKDIEDFCYAGEKLKNWKCIFSFLEAIQLKYEPRSAAK